MSFMEKLIRDKLSEPDSKARDKNEQDIKDIKENQGMTKHDIILEKDENGYGLTVSGDNPVFVSSVKENGAAEKAGVHQGDKIIKVNGKLVTQFDHKQVVKLIKASPHVNLSVLRNDPCLPAAELLSTGADRSSVMLDKSISGPHAVDPKKAEELQSGRISTIRMYYETTMREYEALQQRIRENGTSTKLQQQLQEKQKVLQNLESQLYTLTGVPAESQPMSPNVSNCNSLLPPSGWTPKNGSGEGNEPAPGLGSIIRRSGATRHKKTNSESLIDITGQMGVSIEAGKAVSRSNSDPRRITIIGDVRRRGSADDLLVIPQSPNVQGIELTLSNKDMTCNSPAVNQELPLLKHAWVEQNDSFEEVSTPAVSDSNLMSEHMVMPMTGNRRSVGVTPSQDAHILSMEDGEFTDEEHVEEHGPFSDLATLKNRYAHLAVFLKYLMFNKYPSPLLFYLATDQFTQGSSKEMRKWAYEIFSTFLHENAPLRINIDEKVVNNIASIIESRTDNEDRLRHLFGVARHLVQGEISDLLADFRNKKALGLGNFYGAEELQENMDRAQELKAVEKILYGEYLKLVDDDSEWNQALVVGLTTFFRIVGLNPGKQTSALERGSSFATKDKIASKFKFGSKGKGKGHSFRGHNFVPQQYLTTTFCGQCSQLIWGVGNQGFQCTHCEYNAHKQCLEKVTETCTKKKKENRKSMLDKIGIRKTTGVNALAIKEAQRLHEENQLAAAGLATQSSVFHHRAGRDEDDDELADLKKFDEKEELFKLSQRTTSMPSIPGSFGGSASKRMSGINSYSGVTPPLTPGSKAPKQAFFAEAPDNVKNQQGRVRALAEHYEVAAGEGKRTPIRGASPEPEEDHKVDVQVDDNTLKALGQSGSSSTSSLSISIESPPHSVEDSSFQPLHPIYTDSDMEVDVELPPLDQVISKELIKKLDRKEKKRQEVLNELMHTEQNHVHNLKVMYNLIYEPLRQQGHYGDLVKLLFPNLEQLIAVHSEINKNFKKLRKEVKKENTVFGNIADILLDRFQEDRGGIDFRNACSTFCRDQSHALDVLRHRLRKDQKLAQFLQEVSNKPQCRRLELKDLIPTVMQRLTKYPLFIESLLKHTSGKDSSDNTEADQLKLAQQCAKDALAYVNQSVRECENKHKLEDLQKRLKILDDVPELKDFDLRAHKLVYDGPLIWRLNKQKQVELHGVLLEEMFVLLQKQDEKLYLRMHSLTIAQQHKFLHSPIILTDKMFIKQVATDRKGFFIVSNMDKPQIYELIAQSTDSKKIWFHNLTEVIKRYEGAGGGLGAARVPTSESAEQLNKVDKNVTGLATRSRSMDIVSEATSEVVEQDQGLISPTEVVVSLGVVVEPPGESDTERVSDVPAGEYTSEATVPDEMECIHLALKEARYLQAMAQDHPLDSIPESPDIEECPQNVQPTLNRRLVLEASAKISATLDKLLEMHETKKTKEIEAESTKVNKLELGKMDSDQSSSSQLLDNETVRTERPLSMISTDSKSSLQNDSNEEDDGGDEAGSDSEEAPHTLSDQEDPDISPSPHTRQLHSPLAPIEDTCQIEVTESLIPTSVEPNSPVDSGDSDTEKLEIHESSDEEHESQINVPEVEKESLSTDASMGDALVNVLPVNPLKELDTVKEEDMSCPPAASDVISFDYHAVADVTNYYEEIKADTIASDDPQEKDTVIQEEKQHIEDLTGEAQATGQDSELIITQTEMDCQTDEDPEFLRLLDEYGNPEDIDEIEEEEEGEEDDVESYDEEEGAPAEQEEFQDSRENLDDSSAA